MAIERLDTEFTRRVAGRTLWRPSRTGAPYLGEVCEYHGVPLPGSIGLGFVQFGQYRGAPACQLATVGPKARPGGRGSLHRVVTMELAAALDEEPDWQSDIDGAGAEGYFWETPEGGTVLGLCNYNYTLGDKQLALISAETDRGVLRGMTVLAQEQSVGTANRPVTIYGGVLIYGATSTTA